MLTFIIKTKNSIGKQKKQILLRNRILNRQNFEIPKRNKIFPILSSDFKPFLQTYSKGVHFSFFYDKLISKVPKDCIKTTSVHNLQQILKAKGDFLLISPIFFTKSHSKTQPLGILKLFNTINKTQNKNFILLGGMNEDKFNKMKRLDFKDKIRGFAGITTFI
jgi:hypothetical protein